MVGARLEGVVEVHGILGQHGDQGEQCDGQWAGDVTAGRFGRPGQDEGRGDDAGAVDQHLHDVRDVVAEDSEAQEDGGNRGSAADRQRAGEHEMVLRFQVDLGGIEGLAHQSAGGACSARCRGFADPGAGSPMVTSVSTYRQMAGRRPRHL